MKNGCVGAYKEELIAMVDVKRALVADREEEKMTCFSEMKLMEETK